MSVALSHLIDLHTVITFFLLISIESLEAYHQTPLLSLEAVQPNNALLLFCNIQKKDGYEKLPVSLMSWKLLPLIHQMVNREYKGGYCWLPKTKHVLGIILLHQP